MVFRDTENPLETGHFDPRGSLSYCLAHGLYGKQLRLLKNYSGRSMRTIEPRT
jgi:hypothetical protein